MVGGAETVALDLSRKLDPGRYEVRVLAPLAPIQSSGHADMEQRFLDAGIATDNLAITSFHNPLSILRLYLYFRRGRFDIVHGHNRLSDAWAVEIGALAGIPHRFWTRHLVYQDMTAALIRRYSRLSRKADLVFAVSDAVRENCIEVERIAPEKVVTLVNGIDTERYCPIPAEVIGKKRRELGVTADEHLLLYVARMNEQKAPEGFVRLIWRLREMGVPARGFMCGTGPIERDVRNLIADGPTGVEMLGVRNDIPALLGTADLFVSTSRNEGLPLNVMEAMSSGAAFVAPNIEQISCLLANSGLRDMCLYAPPPQRGDLPDHLIDTWAAKVAEVVKDDQWRRTVGAKSREIIRAEYSLERMVSAYQDAYEETLTARSRTVP
ncbi:glycosyltransferase family 4 protein [bacterium]|nr:glycosyltransferase family 4 protein [bacterium]